MQLQIDIGKILYEAAIYIFIAIFIGISQAAGIGGGPILNICLMLGLGYETKESMAITYIFLIGGSVASMYSNYGQRTKDQVKNVIDSNLVIITLPMTVSGSIFGALFNHYISQLIITVAFTILLSYLAYNSCKKYVELLKSSKNMELSQQFIRSSVELQQFNSKKVSLRLVEIVSQQLSPFPLQKIFTFFQVIIYTVVLLLIKGGHTYNSIINIEKCGFASWVCVFLHLFLSYTVAKRIALKQFKIDQQKESLGFVFKNQQDRMTKKYLNKAMILGFAGGFTGGMLGIGGAIILVPAWLEMGIDKNVASGSSAPLIFSSAFISMVIAMLCHFYYSYTAIIFYLLLSFIASYYVKKIINVIKQKYRLDGMIYLLLIVVMGMSLVFLLPYSFGKMILDPESFFAFGHMC